MQSLLSLLIFLPFLVPVIVAQFGERNRGARYATYGLLAAFNVGLLGIAGLLFLSELLMALQPAQLPVQTTSFNTLAMAIATLLTAFVANLPLVPGVRRWLVRWLPIDPDSIVHATALTYAVYFVGLSIGQMLLIGNLETLAQGNLSLTILDVILSELPLLVFALVGVGMFVRRGWRATWQRLGVLRPTWKQLLAALGIAILLIAFDYGVNYGWDKLDPAGYDQLQRVTENIFGGLMTVGGAFALGLSAGIAEELLFRGAVQPRLGLFLATVLFALGHLQYGFTIATAEVFVIGLVLGLMRRRTSTTVTMVIHATYNTLGVILGLLQP